jgi:hypothetical protein
MRKFILIAAFVLASATAQAGGTRGLALASGDEPAAAEQPKAAETPKPAEAPKSVSRPAAVNLSDQQPQADEARPGPGRNSHTPRAERPRRKRGLTLTRVVYELHRHGIYW